MFKNNDQKFLMSFVSNHANLTDAEKNIISKTLNQLNDQHVSQYREMGLLTHSLQILSLTGKLSTDGLLLLKKLHQKDWFVGILYNLRFLR